MRSIRGFLTVVILAAIVLVLFAAVFQGYRKGIAETQALLDQHLIQYADLLNAAGQTNPIILPSQDKLQFQVFTLSGAPIMRSESAPIDPMLPLEAALTVGDISFANQRWRVVHRISTQHNRQALVAEPVTTRFDIAEQVVNATLWPMILGVPVLTLLAWGTISIGLRHLNSLARAVAQRGEDNISPINLPGVPSELSPVVRSMNSMLARLAGSIDRERRFAADAAHELRTPLSALKVNVFNLRRATKAHDQLDDMAASLNRLSHLIDQLLLLYRTGSEGLRQQFEAVDLTKLCQQCVQDRYPHIQQRRQHIELIGDTVVLSGNHFALSALIGNLIDNASKYTPEGGSIQVTLEQTDGGIGLHVDDSGIGIDPDLRERVLDRFFRVNSGSDIQGCGLGLSIVQHVATLHSASLAIKPSIFDTGTRVSVLFPTGTSANL